MALLIFTVAFGILFAVFATQNTGFASIRFGQFLITGIPLYMVVLASILLGLLVAGIFSFFGWASSSLRIMGRDNRIKDDQRVINDLREKVTELEIENEKLSDGIGQERRERIKERVEHTGHDTRNFFDRLRNNLSI